MALGYAWPVFIVLYKLSLNLTTFFPNKSQQSVVSLTVLEDPPAEIQVIELV